MHIITQKRIWEAMEKWPRIATALEAWYRIMKASEPKDFAAMKGIFPATDKVGRYHVFDIGGNKIRLIAIVHYRAKRVYIHEILDHVDYDKGRWRKSP
ncbi:MULTISPECIES: type II toxin-antitoxin system HigB family toxin [Halomonadaceae]|uniref:Type II toxin-antitoxin system toxin HigB n=1 Tax=Modicisalibacter zincidurans TaxID=1178777 RepID=A0ABP9R5A7_9GAMM|nr:MULTISPECIES: type II toxin-antitoxin system HigB family toxin [Halomonas]MCD6007294.1 type II toxin-antitoxin system HigB family toxin [Halomonas sp. IOP_31]